MKNRKIGRFICVIVVVLSFAMSMQLTAFAAEEEVTIQWEGYIYITTPPSNVSTIPVLELTSPTTKTIYVEATYVPGSSWNIGVTNTVTGADGWQTYISPTQVASFTATANQKYNLRFSTYSTSGWAYIVIYTL